MKKLLPFFLLLVSVFIYGQKVDSTIFFPDWNSSQKNMLMKSTIKEFYQETKFLCYNIKVDKYDFIVVCEFNNSLQGINFIDINRIQDNIVDLIYNNIRNYLYTVYDNPVEIEYTYTKWITGNTEIILFNDDKIKRNQIEIRKL